MNPLPEKTRLGFEIELEFDRNKVPVFSVGSYHEGMEVPGLKFWTAEDDHSLNTTLPRSSVCEFVSKKLTKNNFQTALDEFQLFFSKNGQQELHEVIKFNSSTGAHIHFSIQKTDLKSKYSVFHEKTLHKLVIKHLRELGFSESFITKFELDYHRSYAKTDLDRTSRYECLNFRTPDSDMEWRGFHLRGITTWREFRKAYDAAIAALGEFLKTQGTLNEAMVMTTQKITNRTELKNISVSVLDEEA